MLFIYYCHADTHKRQIIFLLTYLLRFLYANLFVWNYRSSAAPGIFRATICKTVCPMQLECFVCPVCDVGVLSANGWMDQDETWHGGRPHPGHTVLDRDPAPSPKKGHSPQFLAHVCCGQTAGWINMPLSMEAGVGPDDIVLDWGPVHLPKKGGTAASVLFGQCIGAKRLDGSRCHLVWS